MVLTHYALRITHYPSSTSNPLITQEDSCQIQFASALPVLGAADGVSTRGCWRCCRRNSAWWRWWTPTRRRNEAVERFDCMAYTAYGDLLADPAVELVILALPSHLHADLSIAALDVGKHVVCEKPMATSLADADRMVAAAEQRDHLLTIFQNRRYDAHFAKVRSLIDSGAWAASCKSG
ncbi:MAG: Gfo/Idh/MocA family oxidoreductase [Caldilineaceae bacterium]